jgi:hypothetical protein
MRFVIIKAQLCAVYEEALRGSSKCRGAALELADKCATQCEQQNSIREPNGIES